MIQGINCPLCDGETTVYDKQNRRKDAFIWRRRECLKCGHRFTTHETIVTKGLAKLEESEK